MSTILLAEYQKIRRKRIWLFVFLLIAVQLVWALWSFRNPDINTLRQGWERFLYQLPALNAIMMPIITAVIASRLCDLEHKGQTLKLLHTLVPSARLFDAKFICGSLYVLAAVILQLIIISMTGHSKGFLGDVPVTMLAYYLLFTTAVSLTILLLQQTLSLLFANQMIALSVGVLGGFIGLFVMFLPPNIAPWILWGYYGVLMPVGMNWDPVTRVADFYWQPVNGSGFITLSIIFCVMYMIGRTLFVRKEV